jgi:hypothetical protein
MEGKTLPTPHLQKEMDKLLQQVQLLQEQMTATPDTQEAQEPKPRKHGHPRQDWEDVESLARTMVVMYSATQDLAMAFLDQHRLDVEAMISQIGKANIRTMRTAEAMYNGAPVLVNCHKDNIERTSMMDAMICVLAAINGSVVTAEVLNNLQHMGPLGNALSIHLFDVPLVALLGPDTQEKQNTYRKRALGLVEKRIKALENASVLLGDPEKRAAHITNPWSKRNPIVASWCVDFDFWAEDESPSTVEVDSDPTACPQHQMPF